MPLSDASVTIEEEVAIEKKSTDADAVRQESVHGTVKYEEKKATSGGYFSSRYGAVSSVLQRRLKDLHGRYGEFAEDNGYVRCEDAEVSPIAARPTFL